MKGLKITQTNGASEIISDTNVYNVLFVAQTKVGNLSQSLRIISAGYAKVVATALVYFTDTVAQYNGSNVLYEFGSLTEAGSFQVICSNR